MAAQHQDTPQNSATAQQLWSAFKKGDAEAYSALYRQFSRLLINYGYRVTSNTALIKDSVQDLFVELWKSRESLADLDSSGVKFYLFRALRNKINNNRRFELVNSGDIAEKMDETLSSEEQMIDQESKTEQHFLIDKALKALSKRQREIISLRFYNDFSHDEIAEIMGLNYQSVSNLLYTALQTLRKQFRIPF